jgi:hypothetical protein
MRKLLLSLAATAAPALALAQDPCVTAPTAAPVKAAKQLRTTVTPLEPAPHRGQVQESRAPAPTLAPLPASHGATQEELDFLANGPRLYPMDKALELSKQTGKPVVCWMGRHLFADASARRLSRELGETTIQAAMDDDGETGKVDPRTGNRIPEHRVKFSSSNYQPTALSGPLKTAYIPLEKMDRPGAAERILAFARGSK